MITHFADRRLRDFHLRGVGRRLPPHLLPRLGAVPDRMDDAGARHDLDLPGYRLHQLTGELAGFRSIRISGNWRVVFPFDGRDIVDLRFVDYH